MAGYSSVDDGLVIDLRPLNRIDVDPQSQTVRVGAGVTWGELDQATQEHGLATTGGRMTTTGVAGFTLGSGSGWLERLHGLACDNLLSAEVVTADGRILNASGSQNPDLFWGLCGGGGNFGVVTEFEFKLHPVGPMIFGGMVMHPRSHAPEVARFFRDFMREAPREVGGGLILMNAPPAPFVPPELKGQPVVALFAAHFGTIEDGARALAPLKEHGEPPIDLLGPMPYVAFQAMTDGGNPPRQETAALTSSTTSARSSAARLFIAARSAEVNPSDSVLASFVVILGLPFRRSAFMALGGVASVLIGAVFGLLALIILLVGRLRRRD